MVIPLLIEREEAEQARKNLDVLHTACHVIDTLLEEGFKVSVNFSEAKLGEVGLEGDLGEVILAVGDGGLGLLRHVVLEHLLELLATLAFCCLHSELSAEDVAELGAIPVAPSGDLLFSVVVV